MRMIHSADSEIVVLVATHMRNWVRQAAIRLYEEGLQPATILGCTDCDASEIGGPMISGVDVVTATELSAAARMLGQVKAMISWEDPLIVTCAMAADALGIGRGELAGLRRARNKHATRTALEACGAPNARFALVSDAEDCRSAGAAVGFPAILKPVNGSGSILVSRVNSENELIAALTRAQHEAQTALQGRLGSSLTADGKTLVPNRTFLVEEFLDGVEIDLEVVVRDGRTSICQMSEVRFAPTTFMETAFVTPPISMTSDTRATLTGAAAQVTTALGLVDTTANMTFRVTSERGPVLIEVNGGRPGGHMLAPMAWYAHGIDLLAENLALALGEAAPPRREPVASQVAAITLYPETSGILLGAPGRELVAAHDQVLALSSLAGEGRPYPSADEPYPLTALVVGFTELTDLETLRCELTRLAEFVVA